MKLETIIKILKDHGHESFIAADHLDSTKLVVRCVQHEATYVFSENTPMEYLRAFLGY